MAQKMEVQLKSSIKRREFEYTSMQRVYDLSVEARSDPSKIRSFLARYKHVDRMRQDFLQVNDQVNCLELTIEPEKEIDNNVLVSFDDLYFATVEFANTLESTNQLESSETSMVKSQEIKRQVQLPKLQIPQFDGSIENWQTFKDSYVPLIHENQDLSNTEKFHYLVSYLLGNALVIAKGVPITEANYSIVFNSLLERYDNKRVLASAYLDKIYQAAPLSRNPSLEKIQQLTNTLYESVHALRALKIEELGEFVLFYISAYALDPDTRKRFELQNQSQIPKIDDLLAFLHNQLKVLEVSQVSTGVRPNFGKGVSNSRTGVFKGNNQQRTSFVACNSLTPQTNVSCPYCNGTHSIYRCVKLQAVDVPTRRQFVNDSKLCFNCLRTGHGVRNCVSKIKCALCSKKHNTLVHLDQTSPSISQSKGQKISVDQGKCTAALASSNIAASSNQKPERKVTKILGSAVVRVRHRDGSLHLARALIDSCSMDNFITTACARRLELPIKKCQIGVAGLGESAVHAIKGVTFCSIMPRRSENPSFDLPLVVLQKITSTMPSSSLPKSIFEPFKGLDLADNEFYRESQIDLLLGVECFDRIYTGSRFAPGPDLPCALSSVFGWVISGQFRHNAPDNTSSQSVTSLIASTCALDEIVQKFWDTEEPPKASFKNPDNEIAEQIYRDNTYRNSDGRYVVPIMLKSESPSLGDSYHRTLNRFLNLEKRLIRDLELKAKYTEFMRQYEELGHMSPVAPSSTDRNYLIPHHGVLKSGLQDSSLRVVFDASSKTTNGYSLNEIVHVGPKLQTDIIDLIIKFRLHLFVFTADICKMYRQILIKPEDRSFQHILWRNQPNAPVIEYELNTVTYGVSSSPYLAIRTLRQLAKDHGHEYSSRASQALIEETFVDDIITGENTLEAAKELRNNIESMLARGQFELRKWSSNDLKILNGIPAEYCQSSKSFDEGTQDYLKILGIKWDPTKDIFSYNFSEPCIEFTKRSILSTVARIFDPLGWICPVIFAAKVLLQEMWRLNLSWDETIPKMLSKKWHVLAANLHDIQQIELPRLVLPPNATEVHLVGFCDGSLNGYGCCVYLCTVTPEVRTVSLLIGKSRVAPLKSTTVNRLELCAAVLLSRVLSHVHNILKEKIKINSVRAYSDSHVTLYWLKTQPHLLKMYVANRVIQATDLISPELWYHVSTKENPADCCSRGTTSSDLAFHPLWWTGPSWLRLPLNEWPSEQVRNAEPDLTEFKSSTNQTLASFVDEDVISKLFIQYSSLTKLVRVLAWCLRFIKKCTSAREERLLIPSITSTESTIPGSAKKDRLLSSLTSTELNGSLMMLVKYTQNTYMRDELNKITSNQFCSKFLQKLVPYIDKDGLMRVGGRIDNADLPMEALHPYLLPKCCPLSRLIVESYHLKFLHCGPRTLQSFIQRKFWITGVRLLIRSVLSKCVTCFKIKPQSCQPLMGKLPASRLRPGKCFQTTGIDFGGPFLVKESKRRNARTYKAYICLFVCLSTKAVHLEAVTELSSEAFLAALDRFVSRRGLCKTILTDCGTNFVGANRRLKEITNELRIHFPNLSEELSNREIKWEFNPPGAPHFGGIFESGIKSVKFHLKRVVGTQILTLEEMFTILCKIEAILNSRPLCALSVDPNELDVLTPGHFLVGGPLVSMPESPNEMDISPRSRWRLVQKLTQGFWRIWQRDYLHTLQQRNKWFQSQPNVKVGDLVIIVEPNLPSMQWRMARIQELHPGNDNIVRVVTIRMANGSVFRRPVVKICPLPM